MTNKGKVMEIITYRVKQYNSTNKTVIMVDGKPVCIVQGCGKTVSNIVAYLNGYDVEIQDGKIERLLEEVRRMRETEEKAKRYADDSLLHSMGEYLKKYSIRDLMGITLQAIDRSGKKR